MLFCLLTVCQVNGQAQSDFCCEQFFIYGNNEENAPYQIERFNGGLYLLWETGIFGEFYPLFTKFDMEGQVIWERKLDLAARVTNFVTTENNTFLLSGRTEANEAILVEINEDGQLISSHSNIDQNFITAIANISDSTTNPSTIYALKQSSSDETTLVSLNEAKNINWAKRLTSNEKNITVRKIISSDDGSLIVFGSDWPETEVFKIDAGTGQLTKSVAIDTDYGDALALDDGRILISGRADSDDIKYASLTILDENLEMVTSKGIPSHLGTFSTIEADENGNIYLSGKEPFESYEILYFAKARVEENKITFENTKFFNYDFGRSDYSRPKLTYEGGHLHFTIGIRDHELEIFEPVIEALGDVMFGDLSLDLTNECLIDTILPEEDLILDWELFNVSVVDDTVILAPFPIEFIEDDLIILDLCQTISAVHEGLNSSLLKIYPQPAREILNIEVPEEWNPEINIYDLTGKLRLSKVRQSTIRVGGLAQGLYVVEVRDLNTNLSTSKLIVISGE